MNYAVIGILSIVGAATLCAWAWERAEHDVRERQRRERFERSWPYGNSLRWHLYRRRAAFN